MVSAYGIYPAKSDTCGISQRLAMCQRKQAMRGADFNREEYLLFYKTLSRQLRSRRRIARVLHKIILRGSIKPLPTDKVFRDNPRRSHYWAQGQYKLF
jgi:hypothetical protein